MECLNILVVDDHELNRYLLIQQLLGMGHRVEEAQSAVQALELLVSKNYDVLFTDCNMPGMDGFELVREYRAYEGIEKNGRCLIVGFTASTSDRTRERCLASGMDECLFKPINSKVLSGFLQGVPQRDENGAAQSALDADYILELFDGDKRVSLNLFKELHESNTRDLKTLDALLASGDHRKMKSLIHHILGGARIVAAQDLVESALYFEEIAEKGIVDDRFKRSICLIRSQLISLQHDLKMWMDLQASP
ncbi:response regulator [Pseudomonas caspiana]|uniref:Response regulator n=1 Tax=Pseudomonas caspiana TaxID=1451454 RepID=A0A1Y3NWD0_9PSED|nr:response regulator [Pseudomonas caspiana]OUM71886.1 hypothetical protein AUC60_21425 [Pseudomonas caspiana]